MIEHYASVDVGTEYTALFGVEIVCASVRLAVLATVCVCGLFVEWNSKYSCLLIVSDCEKNYACRFKILHATAAKTMTVMWVGWEEWE